MRTDFGRAISNLTRRRGHVDARLTAAHKNFPTILPLIITLLIITRVSNNTDLLVLLTDVGRMLRTEADRRARTQGMSRAQWVILMRLDRQPGLSQKELAEMLEVEPITVARLADRLEARGLLERRADPNDRRVWRLHLLDAAQPVLEEMDMHRHDLLDLLIARLDPGAAEIVTTALLRMRTNLSRRPELETT